MINQAYRYTDFQECKLAKTECRAGIRFLDQLRQSMLVLDEVVDDEFQLVGKVCLNECGRDCVSAFQCRKHEICFFGHIDPESDPENLFPESDSSQQRVGSSCSTFMRMERTGLQYS